MSEAARRLAREFLEGPDTGLGMVKGFEWLLAKIRERRDERIDQVAAELTFYDLFDDGAEFGPDEEGPTFRRVDDLVVVTDADGSVWDCSVEEYRAIQEGPKLEDM